MSKFTERIELQRFLRRLSEARRRYGGVPVGGTVDFDAPPPRPRPKASPEDAEPAAAPPAVEEA